MKIKFTKQYYLFFFNLIIAYNIASQNQMAIWDFSVVNNASTSLIQATTDFVNGNPTLKQYYQTIDDNGKNGISFTDINSIFHSAGSAIAWDDIKGSGLDAELQINISTLNWENISIRFDYKSQSAQSFSLRYSLDNGASWLLLIDNGTLNSDGFNSWFSKTINLSNFNSLENQSSILFKISELDITGNDKFAFDNIEIYGSQITYISGNPTIEKYSSTTVFLNNNYHSGSASSVLSDPTDPCKNKGIDFIVKDNNTPLNSLILNISSSNQNIVPNTNLYLTSINDSIKNLKINPINVGYTDITISVNDGNSSSSYILNLSVSQEAYSINSTNFHTGIADASTSVDVGENYILVADDETNALLMYHKDSSGYLLNSFNVGSAMGLVEEGDFEASFKKDNRAYWIGSCGNSSSGNLKPDRTRFFATDIIGYGSSSSINYVGSFDIRSSIIAWGDSKGYNFTASAADGMIPKQIGGLNIEGMCLGQNNTTLFIGFRAPLIPITNRTKAIICPIFNFETWFNNGLPLGEPSFGNPIELDLGGRGIRSIEQNLNGQFLIVAGSYDSNHNFALFEWDGNETSSPILLTSDLTSLNPEGIANFPSPFYNGSSVELISDDGTEIWYNDGVENKLLSDANNKKFRTVIVPTSGGSLSQPVSTEMNFKPIYKIYPNPTSDKINIEGLQNINSTIQIIDNLGQIVLIQDCKTNNISFNISSLAKGCYFLTISNIYSSNNFKLIKD